MSFGDISRAAQQAAGAAQQGLAQASQTVQQAAQMAQDIGRAADELADQIDALTRPRPPAGGGRPPISPPLRPTTPGSPRPSAPTGPRDPAMGSPSAPSDFALEAHFLVKYGSGGNRDGLSLGWFRECSGLQVEIEVMEYAEGGQNAFVHKLPGRMKFPNIVLKSGVTKVDNLTKWLSEVQTKFQRYPITIELKNHKGTTVRSWSFIDALPVKWQGPNLNRASNNPAVETIEFVHRGFAPGS